MSYSVDKLSEEIRKIKKLIASLDQDITDISKILVRKRVTKDHLEDKISDIKKAIFKIQQE